MLIVPELGGTEWSLVHQGTLRLCRQELLDPEYALYPHGKRSTYGLGCRGPLCRKASRDYGREVMRNRTGAVRENNSTAQQYDEFLDAYIQYAVQSHAEVQPIKPPRRKLKTSRTIRRDHLIPLSTARMLHKRRARLAS